MRLDLPLPIKQKFWFSAFPPTTYLSLIISMGTSEMIDLSRHLGYFLLGFGVLFLTLM